MICWTENTLSIGKSYDKGSYILIDKVDFGETWDKHHDKNRKAHIEHFVETMKRSCMWEEYANTFHRLHGGNDLGTFLRFAEPENWFSYVGSPEDLGYTLNSASAYWSKFCETLSRNANT